VVLFVIVAPKVSITVIFGNHHNTFLHTAAAPKAAYPTTHAR
jgi:hypothetical protein